jgi:GGDEF domain-containing protein
MLGIRRNSLSYKTALLYIVLTVLLVSVFNFIIWENQSDLITRNQQLLSENQSVRLRQTVGRESRYWGDGTRDSLFEPLAKVFAKEGVDTVVVYSDDGKVLFSRPTAASAQASEQEKVLITRAIAKAELEAKEFFHDIRMEQRLIQLFIPQALSGGQTVVVRAPLLIRSLEADRNVLLRLCLLVTALVIFLQVVFALFLRRIVLIPLARLEQATHEISKGDFSQRIDIRQNDEIGMLASSFNEMVTNLVRIREEDKGANPLTGLPGNNVIIGKIDEWIRSGHEFAVIYADLDNFKAYNDRYGFSKGDDAILFTRDCFVEAAGRFGDASTFVGHEGGDDFVIVSAFSNWEEVCKGIIAAFDGGVKQFYSDADAKQGYIDSVDRQGKKVRFPLMSISLAVASNHFRKITDHRMIVSVAAEMKKFVKKTEGSVYAIDRRLN